MSHLSERINRIFKRTHTFVPKRFIEIIVEFDKLRLETLEKREGLDERVKEFADLFERAHATQDPELQVQLGNLWWADEEARLTYLAPIQQRIAQNCERGVWFRNSIAEDLLERASQAELEIKRIKNKTQNDKLGSTL